MMQEVLLVLRAIMAILGLQALIYHCLCEVVYVCIRFTRSEDAFPFVGKILLLLGMNYV